MYRRRRYGGGVHASGSPEVALRPLTRGDADVLATWASDPMFCREADWTGDLSFEEAEAFFGRIIAAPPRQLFRLGVIHEDQLVGYVDLHGDEPRRRELGFVIGGRSRWGQGLGHRAGAAALSFGFRELGLEEIWSEAYDANARSVRILQRLGMRETGRGEDAYFMGRPTFYRQFAVSKWEWSGSGANSGSTLSD